MKDSFDELMDKLTLELTKKVDREMMANLEKHGVVALEVSEGEVKIITYPEMFKPSD